MFIRHTRGIRRPVGWINRHLPGMRRLLLIAGVSTIFAAVGVAQDLDGASKPGQAQRSVELRQAGVAPPVKPDCS